jgi:hypothetical protein
MKTVAKLVIGLFSAIGVLAGLVLFFYYWLVLCAWLGGGFGTLAALLVAPGFLVFPVVLWIVQGAFPTFYFVLLGVCAISAIVVVEGQRR